MNRFLVRARRIEVDPLADFGLDRAGVGGRLQPRAEVDGDHRAALRFRRCERLQRLVDPVGGGLFKVEIAIDAIRDAFGAEGL